MTEPTRDTLQRLIEDFEATLAKLQSNNVVLATPVHRYYCGGSISSELL
jgi:hypothetical protein